MSSGRRSTCSPDRPSPARPAVGPTLEARSIWPVSTALSIASGCSNICTSTASSSGGPRYQSSLRTSRALPSRNHSSRNGPVPGAPAGSVVPSLTTNVVNRSTTGRSEFG